MTVYDSVWEEMRLKALQKGEKFMSTPNNPMTAKGRSLSDLGEKPATPEPVVIQRLNELQQSVEALTSVVDTLEGALCRCLTDADTKGGKQETKVGPSECHIAMRIREYQAVVEVQIQRIVDLIGRLEV